MLDKLRSSSNIKVYAAAIAAFHAPIAGRLVGRDSAVTTFLRGARRMNPPRPCTVPPWNLTTVLRRAPVWTIAILEPQSTLLENPPAVSTGVGQASRRPVSPFNSGPMTQAQWLGYVPKVLSTPFRAQVIMLSAFFPRRAARSPCSASSGPWEYTLSVLPRAES